MFIIIHVRRVLEPPSAAVYGHRDNPVILSGRMVDPSCITFILHAQKAFGITALLRIFGCRNGFRIFLRLGEIDGDIQISILGRRNPFLILFDTVTSDIIRILTQLVEIIGSQLGIFLIFILKLPDHFARSRHQHTHNLCVKKIPVYHAILRKDTLLIGIIQHLFKNPLQVIRGYLYTLIIFI